MPARIVRAEKVPSRYTVVMDLSGEDCFTHIHASGRPVKVARVSASPTIEELDHPAGWIFSLLGFFSDTERQPPATSVAYGQDVPVVVLARVQSTMDQVVAGTLSVPPPI
jgi:hypothetical protein